MVHETCTFLSWVWDAAQVKLAEAAAVGPVVPASLPLFPFSPFMFISETGEETTRVSSGTMRRCWC